MSPRPLPGPRLARVLALVPWIHAHPGTTITDLARRFEVSDAEIEADLALLPLCGLPPYTADRLIDVVVEDDGAVYVRLAEYFDRPLRLRPDEGVALLASGRALLQIPGSDPEGPLATALAKLEDALGARGAVTVDVGSPAWLVEIQDAVTRHEQVEIDYLSASRDELTTRAIDPVRVFHAFGAWYLDAYCHRAEADRMFRVDRVRAVRPTGRRFEPAPRADAVDASTVYTPDESDLRVRLRLEPEASWVIESLPVEEVTPRSGGRNEVTVAVSGIAFLERLLLRLGPTATILGPEAARVAARSAAQRVLSRYGPIAG